MTPQKVVVGGPTMNNEPLPEPEDEEAPVEKKAAAKGAAKALPDPTRD